MATTPVSPLISTPTATTTTTTASSLRCPLLPTSHAESVALFPGPVRSLREQQQLIRVPTTRRRDFILGGAAAIPFLGIESAPNSGAREIEVGSYLPPLPSDPSFVVFKATSKDTPALRAGNVQPYEFVLPPTWKQIRVANILSGNYCQPKCAEPWVEVKFEDEKQGKVQVVASPIIRLTNKPNATIEDIGSPEKLIASLGPFVTGNTYDPDELLETSIEKHGDQTYYTFLLETPLALTGSHNLAKATAKGSTVVLLVVSADDKQWPSSQKTLKAILDSFQI